MAPVDAEMIFIDSQKVFREPVKVRNFGPSESQAFDSTGIDTG
jgi:hypothetical protein